MPTHPFDLDAKRKERKRDSDLDMLSRKRFERPEHIERELHFFLAQHGNNRGPDGRNWQRYVALADQLITLPVPRSKSDGKRLLHLLARWRVWLGHGGTAQDIAKSLLSASLTSTNQHTKWGRYLLETFPGIGAKVSQDQVWCGHLRKPTDADKQEDWTWIIHRLMTERLDQMPAGWHVQEFQLKQLKTFSLLWRASGHMWQANDEDLARIEFLTSDASRSGELDPQCQEFLAFQRRGALQAHIQTQVPPENSPPTARPMPKM